MGKEVERGGAEANRQLVANNLWQHLAVTQSSTPIIMCNFKGALRNFFYEPENKQRESLQNVFTFVLVNIRAK